MATVITMPDGKNETVFDERDFMELMERYMGWEARRWWEDMRSEDDDAAYIEDLEKEIDGLRTHKKEVMAVLREQSETIARLIREKDIDRKALSTAAGIIGSTTWRELNV